MAKRQRLSNERDTLIRFTKFLYGGNFKDAKILVNEGQWDKNNVSDAIEYIQDWISEVGGNRIILEDIQYILKKRSI